MPRKVTLEDGTEIEIPDSEIEAIGNEHVEAFKTEHGDPEALKQELETSKTAVTDLEAAIKVAEEKGQNAGELRKQLDEAKKSVTEAEDKAKEASTQSNNLLVEEWKSRKIDALTEDPKIKELFEANYNLLSTMPSGNKKEIEARIEAALTLTVPNWKDAGGDMSAFSSAGAKGAQTKTDGKLNETQKNVATALGISEEDAKKYPIPANLTGGAK